MTGAGCLLFREMQVADLEAVCAIERASFRSPWSRQNFLGELRQRPQTYFCVLEEQTQAGGPRLIGYGGQWLVADEAHIVNIAVHPEARRRKLGQRCLLHLMDVALARGMRRVTLEVRPSNQAAIRLYEKFGFVAVALRKRYYQDTNEDAVIMWIADAASQEMHDRLESIRKELAACS